MKTTTNIFHKDEFIRSEGLVTFEQYVRMGRLLPGQMILLGEINVCGTVESHTNTKTIWVGDCTKFHEVSSSDGGIGWNKNSPDMAKYVLEVHTFTR